MGWAELTFGGGGRESTGGDFSRWGRLSKFLPGGGTPPIPPVEKTLVRGHYFPHYHFRSLMTIQYFN